MAKEPERRPEKPAAPAAGDGAKAAPAAAGATTDALEREFGPLDGSTEPFLAHSLPSPAEPIENLDDSSWRSRGSDERRGGGSPTSTWFFGGVVTLLLIVQSLQLLQHETPVPAPGGAPRPAVSNEDAVPLESDIDRLLRESRVELHKGVYEHAIRLLEPLMEDPEQLPRMQRREAWFLLSQAHRAMNHFDRAQACYLRAIDASIDRNDPALMLEDSGLLRDDGRYSESRELLFELLARRDGFDPKSAPLAVLAAARLGDNWYAQAAATGSLAPLPAASSERR